MAQNPIVTFTMADGSVIKAELYPEIAPVSVQNFISLIQKNFYDGLIFHRVIRGFMIQGGDPEGTGMGGPGYSIRGEFAQNGYENELKHTEGVLSMARSMHPNSAGSQFFIMHKTSPHLDGAYAAFGKVTSGIEIVDQICQNVQPVDNNGTVINLADLTFEVNDESLASLTESLPEGLSEDSPEEKVIETIYLKCLVEKEVVTLVIKKDDIVLAKKNIYLGEEW